MNACLLFCHIKVLSVYKFKHAIFYSFWISIASEKSGPQCIEFIYLVFRSSYMTSVILLIFWPCKLFSHLEFIFKYRIRSGASYSRRQLSWQSRGLCWSEWAVAILRLLAQFLLEGLHVIFRGFPSGSVCKESACNAGMQVRSRGQKICWRRGWQPTPIFLPGKSHG